MATFEPRNPDFEQVVRTSFAQQTMMATLGAELLRVEPGLVAIAFPFRAELAQQHGYLHAGAVTAVVDSACGYAALTLQAPGSEVLSVEFKINFLAPARAARFAAVGRVVRSGRTITVCRGEVTAAAEPERPLALMQATMMAVSS